MTSFITLDQSLVLLYLLAVLGIGFFRKSGKNEQSYLFAGRKLTVPAFVATLVATWYGGILEVGRFTYENGIVTWLIFGFTYYLAALIFSRIIAPGIIEKNVRTIPEFLFSTYGKYPALIGILIILFIASPAPYLKMLGTLFQHLWDIPELTALILGTVLSLIYAFRGGFASIVRTDKLQFGLMFAGFVLILSAAISKYGGFDFLIANTPEFAFAIPGNLNWKYIIVWAFIAMVTFIDPGFYQRSFAGDSLKTVRRGIAWSVLCWCIFDGLTVFTGIYASAILPANVSGNPYLELADVVLPVLGKGLFLVALLSIIMSTIDSFSFISAYTIGKDLFGLVKLSNKTSSSVIQRTQIGLIITGILSIFLAYSFPYAIDLWYTAGSFAVPVLLLPLVLGLNDNPLKKPLRNMTASLGITTLWFIFGLLNLEFGYPVYPFGIEPMYPGLIVSVILFLVERKV